MSYCDTLKVEISGVTIGWLTKPFNTSNLSFRYDDEWLRRGRSPISLGLPLTDEPFNTEITDSFFGNLAPDGQALMVISANRKVSSGDIFSFLKHFGVEASGALTIFPVDQKPLISSGEYRDVTDLVLKSLRDVGDGVGNLVIDTESKVSLAGAQNKLPVLIEGERLLVAAAGSNASTTHIIKPASTAFKNLQFNEAFCMELAAESGLPVPESGIMRLEEIPVFVIKRFDRRTNDEGGLIRLQQEDFCQVLGVGKHYKYEEDGGPGFKACSNLLLNIAKVSSTEYDNFIKSIAFNYIIGNCDAHAKNFAILHDFNLLVTNPAHRTYRLAPFYDLVSTRFYPKVSAKMAMFIGNSQEHGLINIDSLARLADDLAIDNNHLIYNFEEITLKTKQALPLVRQKHIELYKNEHLYKNIEKIINISSSNLLKQISRLKKRLDNSPNHTESTSLKSKRMRF